MRARKRKERRYIWQNNSTNEPHRENYRYSQANFTRISLQKNSRLGLSQEVKEKEQKIREIHATIEARACMHPVIEIKPYTLRDIKENIKTGWLPD
jgi:hypothetical protein